MKPEETEPPGASPEVDEPVNPGYGEKGGFRKITVTVPQWAYEILIEESARRKIAGRPNQLLSALMREALTDYLRKLSTQSI